MGRDVVGVKVDQRGALRDPVAVLDPLRFFLLAPLSSLLPCKSSSTDHTGIIPQL
jgi:hypothetical protein